MTESNDVTRRRILSGFCFAALALLFLSNPLTHLIARGGPASPARIAASGFVVPFTMVLLVGVVFGIAELLRARADRTGLIGGALTIAGWTVGCRIIVLGQLESLLQSGVTGVPADTLDKMFTAAPVVWLSIVPMGLMFPLGLIVLGAALVATAPVHRAIGALLVAGGVLFPVGRAVRLEWALGACDVALGLSFALLGWEVLRRRESLALRPA
ncbi:MAG TPA: hypothetical protein VGF28_17865 [Thermoanaerobaculia bacterium]|jgi:hypothetical protein